MQKQGFSLVELSIVLVILGLLAGGILTGQNLIRAAELRSVVTDFKTYQTAVMTFRDKYFYLPGDMPNATDFWGAMTGCNASGVSGVGTEVCNGNGDGQIDGGFGANINNERMMIWKHLANAGLIEGNYTGIAGPLGGSDSILGVNVPASKVPNSGWGVVSHTHAGQGSFIDNAYINTLIFGGRMGSGSGMHSTTLKPEEAWNIDTKIDDGLPAQGRVWGIWWDVCSTATSSSQRDGKYDLQFTGDGCALAFLNSM